MDELMILRTFAAVTTVLAAALVAANLNARITVAGFMIFIVASIAWMVDGWLESKASLVIQNAILLLINVDRSLALVSEGREGSEELESIYSQNPSRRRKALLIATAACAPSAMATATRRTSRDTSPATYTPGTLVSSVSGSMTTPPFSSRLQPRRLERSDA